MLNHEFGMLGIRIHFFGIDTCPLESGLETSILLKMSDRVSRSAELHLMWALEHPVNVTYFSSVLVHTYVVYSAEDDSCVILLWQTQ